MENLVFSLNATIPVFLLMVLGFVLRKTALFKEHFAELLNRFVFQVSIPLHLFKSLATSDFRSAWDGKLVAFCFFATLISILISLGLSFLLREKALRGEFAQASYRGSLALLGAALMQNIYGESSALALGLLGAVPIYNVAAVALLTLTAPGAHLDRAAMKKTLLGIVKNPIILGIGAGLFWSLLKLPQPAILMQTVSSMAATATPMGLLALGACVEINRLAACWKPAAVSGALKLVVFGAMFVPLAVQLGFRGEALVVILIIVASPTTVSCFNMARSLGHEGTLSAEAVMLTTICSAFTFTLWLFVLRGLGWI